MRVVRAKKFGETVRNLKAISPTYQNMVPAAWMLFAEALEQDDDLARTFFSRVRLLQYGGAALGQAYADRIQAVAVRTVACLASLGLLNEIRASMPAPWPERAQLPSISLKSSGASLRKAPSPPAKSPRS